jgi:hypothetical protein
MTADSSDIRAIIDRLVEERQFLRNSGGDPAALNANRVALAYWQVQLTRVSFDEAVSQAS